MPHDDKPTVRQRPQPERAPAGDEPARFLRNLTSLPDADFASTYSPAIAAAFASYADLPDPAAAKRALLLALKAALKRRRAFILPRFTQAEDSWRIRECASYAVAIVVLVEHARTLLERSDPPTDPDAWARLLRDPTAVPEGTTARAALFHAIVPAQGRRWIAREPLVQTLIANYFTDTAPNELRDIIAPVVAAFGHDRQATRLPPVDDPPSPLDPVPNHPSRRSQRRRSGLLTRTFARARATFSRRLQLHREPDGSRSKETKIIQTVPIDPRRQRDDVPSPVTTSSEPGAEPCRVSEPEPPAGIATATPLPPPASGTHSRSAPAPKPSRHRRSGPRVADILDGLPTTPPPRRPSIPDSQTPARRPAIGDHGAATARIGHAAGYARQLAVENSARPPQQTTPFVLSGAAPDPVGPPLAIDALFPTAADPGRVDSDALAAWIDFRDHLIETLRSGAQNANEKRSLIHLLDIGAFLVWPQVALPFADERRIAPAAIKSAMRAARVLAVNRADRQDDRHDFPALTGDPNVTCHGLVTLPEYLWPDASLRPTEPSTFVRPPAIYGQRHRRPH